MKGVLTGDEWTASEANSGLCGPSRSELMAVRAAMFIIDPLRDFLG